MLPYGRLTGPRQFTVPRYSLGLSVLPINLLEVYTRGKGARRTRRGNPLTLGSTEPLSCPAVAEVVPLEGSSMLRVWRSAAVAEVSNKAVNLL